MSIKKRKIKNNFFLQVKIFVAALIGIALLFCVVYLSFLILSPKKELFINPLALNRNNNQNQIDGLLQKSGIAYVSIKKQNATYVVTLNDEGQVILTENKNIQNQISSLQLILSRLTIEGKRFKSLDFRYDKPVVSF